MTLFTDSNLLSVIRGSERNKEEFPDIEYLEEWLRRPPSHTTFRINKLKPCFTLEMLMQKLREQNKELKAIELPICCYLRPDCLLVKQWPTEAVKPGGRKEVTVDSGCGAAVLRGAHVYAPGVMGMPTDLEMNELVDIIADVEGKCKRGLKIAFEGRKLFVGIGRVNMLRPQLFMDNIQPSGIAVQVVMPASKLPVINESVADIGQVLLQNLPSIVCGWVVDPRPGEYVLDMCAAPGNKTTHLAELSNNGAFIVALDKTTSKVAKIKEICQNHSITCVQSYVQDSTKCFSEESKSTREGPPFPENSFDKVLLDAPCSALGQRPQLANKMTVKMLQSYKFLQRRLFSTAVKLVKVGGCLVYSTCTISESENEGLVRWALDKFPCLELVAAKPLLGGPGWPGCGLNDQQRLLVQRFGPEEDLLRCVDDIYRDTVGFFIAKFVKKQNV